MADNVQWIRLKIGMFDGNSFKKIKRAKIGGVSYRDKLTAVWFELLDLGGKSNANGFLIDNNEIPYQSFSDIATMLDREDNEIELCMGFFISEKMVEIVDDTYLLTNFVQYQNQAGLEKIRAQNRERQARFREKKKQGVLGCGTINNVDNNDPNNVTSRYITQETPENNAVPVTDNVTSRKSSYSNSLELESKKVSNKKNHARARARERFESDGVFFPGEEKYLSHQELMTQLGVSDRLREVLTEFLRNCYLNKHVISNDTLSGMIVALDIKYKDDEQSKINSVRKAIKGGYINIKEYL